uniref:Secreted protein n=1 Tax=Anopheles darlingi TaxID=43151 RepID=A0A2M4DNK6_ANODA
MVNLAVSTATLLFVLLFFRFMLWCTAHGAAPVSVDTLEARNGLFVIQLWAGPLFLLRAGRRRHTLFS